MARREEVMVELEIETLARRLNRVEREMEGKRGRQSWARELL